MKTYRTQDSQEYVASGASDLVRQLRAESHEAGSSKQNWRADAAYRASEATGTTVRGDSDAHFVDDLINAGLLKETG